MYLRGGEGQRSRFQYNAAFAIGKPYRQNSASLRNACRVKKLRQLYAFSEALCQGIQRVELCATVYPRAAVHKSRIHSDTEYYVEMMHRLQANPYPRAFGAAPNYDLFCFACDVVRRHGEHEVEDGCSYRHSQEQVERARK